MDLLTIVFYADIAIFALFVIYFITKYAIEYNKPPENVIYKNTDILFENKEEQNKKEKEELVIGDLEEIKKIKEQKDK